MLKLPKLFNKTYYTEAEVFEVYDNIYNLSLFEFKLVAQTFFYLLMESVIAEGKVYQLPSNLGTIGVYKTPTYGKGFFDYKLFHEEGIKSWKRNLHSAQYVARFQWATRWPRYNINDAGHIYKFKATRFFSRELSKKIKEKNTISKYYDY